MIDIFTPVVSSPKAAPAVCRRTRPHSLAPALAVEAWAAVDVTNGSPEPDGTYKHYFLQVPATVRTAREGVAWTYGLPEQRLPPDRADLSCRVSNGAPIRAHPGVHLNRAAAYRVTRHLTRAAHSAFAEGPIMPTLDSLARGGAHLRDHPALPDLLNSSLSSEGEGFTSANGRGRYSPVLLSGDDGKGAEPGSPTLRS